MYKTYTKYIKIYESTTPQPHIIRLLAVPGQYRAASHGTWREHHGTPCHPGVEHPQEGLILCQKNHKNIYKTYTKYTKIYTNRSLALAANNRHPFFVMLRSHRA